MMESCGFTNVRSYGWGFTGSYAFLRRPGVRKLWRETVGRLRTGGGEEEASGPEAPTDAPLTGALGHRRTALWFADNVGVLARKV